MPDKFEFLSLEAFKKLTSNERQAYLEKLARYVSALKDGLDKSERKESPGQAAD
jgi:hypothetical protein